MAAAGFSATAGGSHDVSWVSSLYQYSDPVAASTAFCQAKQTLRDGLAEIPAGLSDVRRVAPPPTIAGVNAVADASETRRKSAVVCRRKPPRKPRPLSPKTVA